jgi:hypothetical protein
MNFSKKSILFGKEKLENQFFIHLFKGELDDKVERVPHGFR